jgi:hypothetical protein
MPSRAASSSGSKAVRIPQLWKLLGAPQAFTKKNKIGIRFYEERDSKDLLFIWRDRDRASVWNNQGCSTAIWGDALSVNWGEVSNDYLYKKCRRLTLFEVRRRLLDNSQWETLVFRAAWMSNEMQTKGEAILPWPPVGG